MTFYVILYKIQIKYSLYFQVAIPPALCYYILRRNSQRNLIQRSNRGQDDDRKYYREQICNLGCSQYLLGYLNSRNKLMHQG